MHIRPSSLEQKLLEVSSETRILSITLNRETASTDFDWKTLSTSSGEEGSTHQKISLPFLDSNVTQSFRPNSIVIFFKLEDDSTKISVHIDCSFHGIVGYSFNIFPDVKSNQRRLFLVIYHVT